MSNNSNNPEENSQRAERAIRTHVLWAMGAGFIPLPVADALAVAAVQLDMIRNISTVYGVDFAETQGKAIISSLAGSALSRLGANAFIKVIPVVGSMVGGVSMAIVSGASTYAVGQVFKRHFEVGGTFVDFDTSRFKKFYDEQFEKGKKVAEDMKREEEAQKQPANEQATAAPHNAAPNAEVKDVPKADSSEIVRKLKELAELKEMGVITEDEFLQMKARLIENYK